MNKRYKTSSRRWHGAGLTLVEVVASIALMGVLLSGLVMAQARHTRQLTLAEQKLVAIEATDALLAEWFASEEPIPTNGRGKLELAPQFEWRTRIIDEANLTEIGSQVVRLEVFGDDLGKINKPLIHVDVIVPSAKVTQEDSQEHES